MTTPDHATTEKEKLEAILNNDGSPDETLPEMWAAADEICHKVGRVAIVEWAKNKGKRYGMAEGAARARNDIVVFVERRGPFANDEVEKRLATVGVAGGFAEFPGQKRGAVADVEDVDGDAIERNGEK